MKKENQTTASEGKKGGALFIILVLLGMSAYLFAEDLNKYDRIRPETIIILACLVFVGTFLLSLALLHKGQNRTEQNRTG